MTSKLPDPPTSRSGGATLHVAQPSSGNFYVDHANVELDQLAERFERLLAPSFEAQANMAKTFITLASTALVLGISMAQFLAGRDRGEVWHWLLPASWVLFALTAVLGALSQGAAGDARSIWYWIEERRGRLHEEVADLDLDPVHERDPHTEVRRRTDVAVADIFKKAQRYTFAWARFVQGMAWSFVAGLVALLAFAIRNLPG